MKARDIMSTNVVTASPGTSIREVARLLLKKHLTALPVIDKDGVPIGMISEGDLVGPDDASREVRRDWWLSLLAEGQPLSPDFLGWLDSRERTANSVMSKPVISINEDAEIGEIARLLAAHHVKRVPVVRNGRLVGIVSRGDLLRAMYRSDTDVSADAAA
jgi:CBS domain-containing protein